MLIILYGLKKDGAIQAAGNNNYNQLGLDYLKNSHVPIAPKFGVFEVACGREYSVYLKSDGTVWATGNNGYGQLGDGSTTNRSNPVQVKNADGTGLTGVVGISAGHYHTLYLKSDGTVWAAGDNREGQLGDGSTTNRSNPVQVKNADGTGLTGVVAVSAGSAHAVYLKGDGTVWATGDNRKG